MNKQYPSDTVIKLTLAIIAGVKHGASISSLLSEFRRCGFELDSKLEDFAKQYYQSVYRDYWEW